mgnify:CR=1 FL=1
MKHLILLLFSFTYVFSETLYFNNGKSVEGKILEANATAILFEKAEDKQNFRFPPSMLTEDSKKQLELYHSTNRYSSIPTLPTPLSQKKVDQYAGYIDQLVDSKLRQQRLGKTKKANDSTYVRRLYLTAIGRIPTYEEAFNFLNDRDSNKKNKLIEKLLNSSGYANHQMNWMSDMLRIKDRVNGTNINVGSVYRKWVKESIASNKPYDQMVRDLVSSEGRLLDDGPAISYYLRDRGMQADNLSHTIRIFLGTRLECAMCHNHPFDKWTQRQFYEMTAFTSGIGNVRIGDAQKKIGALSKIISKKADAQSGTFNNWRNQVRDSLLFGIDNKGVGTIKLPKDFAEDDGEPGEIVNAKAMFTPSPVLNPSSKNSREVFADWLTSKDNPRFTTVIANRIWKQIYGAGLIEPIDSMMDDTMSSNEPLMKFLERIMVSVNYDLKAYQRILLSTNLFQRESKKEDHKSLEEYSFEGPILRRMTGEQLWDSLVTLVYNDIDSKNRVYLHNSQDYRVIYERYKGMNASEIYSDFENLIKINEGNRNFLLAIEKESGSKLDKKFVDRHLVRSNYLQHPAPGGHLIRQFGGSDKEQIDNSNSEPNTTQVLNLLNGFVETNILNKKGADFITQMQSEKNKSNQIESVFISILSRKPNAKEESILQDFISKKDGFKHVSWILLNSHEFIFIK